MSSIGCPRANRKLIGFRIAGKDVSALEQPTSGVRVSSLCGTCRQLGLSGTCHQLGLSAT